MSIYSPYLLLSNVLPTATMRYCTASVETPSQWFSHCVVGNIPPTYDNIIG